MSDAKKRATREYNLVHQSNISRGKTRLAFNCDENGQTQFSVQNVELRYKPMDGWFYTEQTIGQPINALSKAKDLLTIGECCLMDGVMLTEVPYGTRDIVTVTFKLKDELLTRTFLERNTVIGIADGVIVMETVSDAGFQTEAVFLGGKANRVIHSDTMESYTMVSVIPSQGRKCTATYCRTDLVEKYESVIEQLTNGTASKYVGVPNDIKDIVKAGARFMLICIGGFLSDFSLEKHGCTIYLGKCGGKQQRTDGGSKISDRIIAEKYDIGLAQARSQFLQMRNFKTSKVSAVCEMESQIKEFVHMLASDLDTEIVYVDSFADIDETAMKGKIVHVGNPERFSFFSDLNGFKNIPKTTDGENDFMVLDMGKESSGHSNLQFLQYTQDYPGYVDLIAKIGKKDVRKKLSRLTGRTKRFNHETGTTDVSLRKYISGLDINLENIYAPNLITQVSPEVFFQGYMRGAIEKAIVSSINTATHKMHFDIDAIYMRGATSPENWSCKYESRFLREGEVYINNAEYWRKQCIVRRNPCSAPVEYYEAEIPSLFTIVDRIEESEATEREKRYYETFYAQISPNAVLTTGSEEFKDKTGGSDFDFDGFAVIFDEAIIAMTKSKPSFRVGIAKSKAKAGSIVCDSITEIMQQAFIRMLTTGNKSIPDLAIEDSKVQTLLNLEDEKLKREIYRAMLERMLGPDYDAVEDKDALQSYRQVYTGECSIGESDVLARVQELKRTPKDLFGVDEFLRDATVMNVSIIGRTIDAAKTGDVVTDPFGNSLDIVHQMFRDVDRKTRMGNAHIEWDENKKEFVAVCKKENYTVQHGDVTHYYVIDNIYRAQVEIITYAVRCINRLRKLAMPTQESVAALKETKKRLSCALSLKELDKASSDMHRINLVSGLDSKAVGKKAINFVKPYISGFARALLDASGIEKEKRFEAAMAINDVYKGSSFAYTAMKEEAILYALNLPNACRTIRERVLPLRNEFLEKRQVFVKGRSRQFVCTSYRFEGTFDVQYEDSFGYFFEIDVADIITIPDATDKALFRIHTDDAGYERMMTYYLKKDAYTFFITTKLGEKKHPDMLWAHENETGNDYQLCPLQLASERITACMNRMAFSIDDVIRESFIKQSDDSFRTISSTSILCDRIGFIDGELNPVETIVETRTETCSFL